MAILISDAAKNRAALKFVTDTIRLIVHVGIPGASDNAANRLAGNRGVVDLQSDAWSLESGEVGIVSNTDGALVGILDHTNDVIVTHISSEELDGTFLTWVSLTQGVTVLAGRSFRLAPRIFKFRMR